MASGTTELARDVIVLVGPKALVGDYCFPGSTLADYKVAPIEKTSDFQPPRTLVEKCILL